MSTKTTFKRIALVAVAALGLGVLSVAPSSAVVSAVTVTATNGTAGLVGAASDTVTGAQISVTGLLDEGTDSITVQFVQRAAYPATAVVVPNLIWLESTTSTLASSTRVDNAIPFAGATSYSATESVTASGGYTVTGTTSGTGTYVGAKFALFLDSAASTTRPAGTYSYTVIVKQYNRNSSTAATTTSHNVDIVIAASASASTTVDPSKTAAKICAGDVTTCSADASVSAVSTADGTVDASIIVTLLNAASGTAATDSVTATVTGAGLISFDGTTYGKTITYAATGSTNGLQIRVRGDGTAGTSSIAVSATSFSATKTVTFYAKAAKTITAAVNYPVLTVGANTGAVKVSAVDANGTNWTGTAYIVASAAADALIGGSATTPVQCAAYNSTDGILCPITTIANGTAKFKVIDASTVALATATSNEVTVTVSNAAPASFKLAFDKATYAPFEKAKITITPLDKDGKGVAAQSGVAIVTAAGITSTYAFSSGSDTLTAAGGLYTDATTGAQEWTVYMPGTGDVTISATGGAALPVSGQVKVSATASVVNSSVDAATDAANEATDAANAATDAALAAADAADAATAAAQDASDAVAALSASVSKMIASLKAQITSLTNLVIKIQKKVRA